MLQLTSAIQLEGLVTKKPRTSKYTMKPQIVSFWIKLNETGVNLFCIYWNQQATESPSTISVYRVNSTSGNTCMLMRTDGLLTIKYRNKLNEDMEADVYLPDYPDLSGFSHTNASSNRLTHTLLHFQVYAMITTSLKWPSNSKASLSHSISKKHQVSVQCDSFLRICT